MADIKMTTFRQQPGETRPDAHLRRLVEVDDDVAAEDHVEIALEGPLRHQVQLVERNEALDLVVNAELAATTGIDFREPLLAHGGRHGFERVVVIDPGAGLRQNLRVDIRREDFEIVIRRIRKHGEHGERNRIGLLPVGTGRRPDADAPAGFRPGDEARQDVITQMFEMMVFAEEAGEIRRQVRQHFAPRRRALR
ncbi:hypothetical protein D3C86_1211760 [compost metagenome]